MFSNMGTLGWIVSIVGTLGVVGTIALAFLAPQLLLVLWKGALELLARILSTRIGCAVIAGLVAGVIGNFIGDHQGAERVRGEWDAAKVAYAHELAELSQKADTHARERNHLARAAEETADRERADRMAAYTAALPRPATDDCRITDRDLAAAGRVQDDGQRRRGNRKARDRNP